MPGGLSATNITHEVAHAAAMNGNCSRAQLSGLRMRTRFTEEG